MCKILEYYIRQSNQFDSTITCICINVDSISKFKNSLRKKSHQYKARTITNLKNVSKHNINLAKTCMLKSKF